MAALRALPVSALLPRMNEGCVQGFETVGNQATGHFIHPGNASNQGSWRKLLLLLLQFPGLVWTSDAPLEEVMVREPRYS